MASKTSAAAEEPIEVLIALHDKFDLLDLAGPVEVLTTALHDFKDDSKSCVLLRPRTVVFMARGSCRVVIYMS